VGCELRVHSAGYSSQASRFGVGIATGLIVTCMIYGLRKDASDGSSGQYDVLFPFQKGVTLYAAAPMETAMRSRLAFTIVFLASVPAFSQPFTLEFTGGTIIFGSAPLNIAVVSPNGGGTSGHLAPAGPPATLSCTPTEAVTLAGSGRFGISGTTKGFGHLWDVEFAFPGPPFANQGNLSASSTNWELTGKYSMTIKDTVTGKRCSKVVGMSGEYQFAGPALSGWPHNCANPTNSNGQSPGLTGSITLGGHAGLFPKFVAGGACSSTLAAQANSRIVNKGFDSVNLDYKLSY
jgi:hypothetical protein